METDDVIIERIKILARKFLEENDDAHGYYHAERVLNLAREIHEHEGGDWLVIAASCYLHDWWTKVGRRYHVSEEAMEGTRGILVSVNFPADKVESVLHSIRHHEDYESVEGLSKECLILKDADELDGLGAIGIARNYFSAAKMGQNFGTPADMVPLEEPYHVGQVTTPTQHFYTKLLGSKDRMRTAYGRELAEGRHAYMVEFLERFKQEWEGKA